MRVRCPTNPTPYDDPQPHDPPQGMAGCGCEFEAEVDDEGLVDCPRCGMFFHPSAVIYRLQFMGGAPLIRIVAEEDDATREIATCRGSGDLWSQAVKDAELIVAALNAHHNIDPKRGKSR